MKCMLHGQAAPEDILHSMCKIEHPPTMQYVLICSSQAIPANGGWYCDHIVLQIMAQTFETLHNSCAFKIEDF